MFTYHSESEACNHEAKILKKAIMNKNKYPSVLFSELNKTSIDMLMAMGRRNEIRLTYKRGGILNVDRLIDNLMDTWKPTVLRQSSASIFYLVVAYTDGYMDIIEGNLADFECPQDATLVGYFNSEPEAEVAMMKYEEK